MPSSNGSLGSPSIASEGIQDTDVTEDSIRMSCPFMKSVVTVLRLTRNAPRNVPWTRGGCVRRKWTGPLPSSVSRHYLSQVVLLSQLRLHALEFFLGDLAVRVPVPECLSRVYAIVSAPSAVTAPRTPPQAATYENDSEDQHEPSGWPEPERMSVLGICEQNRWI